MSRSPVSELLAMLPAELSRKSSARPVSVNVKMPGPRMIVSSPGRAFASMMAARSVLRPLSSALMPSPGFSSTVSRKLLTTKPDSNAPISTVATPLPSPSKTRFRPR